jgi:alkylresorcinol/alkylpyrone synthase
MQILSVCGVLPEHRYSQEEITDAFAGIIAQGGFDEWVLRQFRRNAGVRQRNLVLPLELTKTCLVSRLACLAHRTEAGA